MLFTTKRLEVTSGGNQFYFFDCPVFSKDDIGNFEMRKSAMGRGLPQAFSENSPSGLRPPQLQLPQLALKLTWLGW